MGEAPHRHPTPPPEPAASERLDSWKEIATYLKRSVRTIQRWEKTENLPVYRHTHESRGTVYAHKPEVEAWWNNRRPRLEQQEKLSEVGSDAGEALSRSRTRFRVKSSWFEW